MITINLFQLSIDLFNVKITISSILRGNQSANCRRLPAQAGSPQFYKESKQSEQDGYNNQKLARIGFDGEGLQN